MKILILGANGMLGHKLYQTLFPIANVMGTIKGNFFDLQKYSVFHESNVFCNVDATDINNIRNVIIKVNPAVLINCIGIIKQIKEANDNAISIKINSLVPHELNQICSYLGICLIRISTDYVFSGKKGNYSENDCPDAEDIYGKTKYFGEIAENNTSTIRTSIIGRELHTTNGLVEWLISNRDKEVNGFANAISSGFPTIHFAEIIRNILFEFKWPLTCLLRTQLANMNCFTQ